MVATKTLGAMIDDLRNEVGDSTDAAQGRNARGGYVRALQRTQETLHLDYDWPHLKVQREITVRPGQRFYDAPSDLDLERITELRHRWGGVWSAPLIRGITPDHYNSQEAVATPAATSFTVNSGAAAAATGGFTVTGGTLGTNNKITAITVNGVSIISAAVAWTTSHPATARAVVTAINAYTATSGYTASANGAAVTITADPDLGATANGYTVSVTTGGDVSVGSVSNMASGANNKLSSIKVDGMEILGSAVGWRTSNTATATAIAARINETVTNPAYTAEAAGNEVTISSDTGNADSSNDLEVTLTTAGTFTVSTPADMAGGILASRSDPVLCWDVLDAGDGPQIEVWPVPAAEGTIQVEGIRKLDAFVANSDYCTLDATLITLIAAAEILEDKKPGRGKRKSQIAAAHYARLKSRVKAGGAARVNLAGQAEPQQTMPSDRIRVAYTR